MSAAVEAEATCRVVSVEDIRGYQVWHVERLEMAVTAYSESLMLEFYPQNFEVVSDWRENLTWLRECSFPLRSFLAGLQKSSDGNSVLGLSDWIAQWFQVDAWLIDAERKLAGVSQDEKGFFTSLYDANVFIRKSAAVLRQWRDSAQGVAGLEHSFELMRPNSHYVEQVWQRKLNAPVDERAWEARLAQFDARGTRTFSLCMHSRKSYLVSIYFAMLCPRKWTREKYDKLVDLQKLILKSLTEGSPYRISVFNRLDSIQNAKSLLLGQISHNG